MRNFVPCLRSSLLARVAVVALASGSVAACSSDSSRFGDDPFSNPFSSASASSQTQKPRRERQPDSEFSTGAVQAAPAARVERAPLSAPSSAQSQPLRGYGNGGYQSSSRVEPRATGSVSAPRPTQMASADSNWSTSGGTMVTLGRGETVHTLSSRYGVPASAIIKANGLSSASAAGEGQQILIPTYSASSGGYRVATAAPVEPKPFGARAEVVAPRAEIVAPRAVVTAPRAPVMAAPRAEIAVAAPKPPKVVARAELPAVQGNAKMQFIQGAQPRNVEVKAPEVRAEIRAPEVKSVEVKAKIAAAPLKPAPKPAAEQAFAAAPVKVQTPDDGVKTAALRADPPAAAEPAGPSFRWPARGRVISAYGSKSSGSTNDGVNIAVPEGTDVKASDDGVVAYSGSELKGFGNLVLIRHSNGWVTAYAHNSALDVKRGDTVRRGQVIAKSGSTGNVSSPQLHFEVRKGAQTVDPMKHLPGGA